MIMGVGQNLLLSILVKMNIYLPAILRFHVSVEVPRVALFSFCHVMGICQLLKHGDLQWNNVKHGYHVLKKQDVNMSNGCVLLMLWMLTEYFKKTFVNWIGIYYNRTTKRQGLGVRQIIFWYQLKLAVQIWNATWTNQYIGAKSDLKWPCLCSNSNVLCHSFLWWMLQVYRSGFSIR